jgi:hypothetical protein
MFYPSLVRRLFGSLSSELSALSGARSVVGQHTLAAETSYGSVVHHNLNLTACLLIRHTCNFSDTGAG